MGRGLLTSTYNNKNGSKCSSVTELHLVESIQSLDERGCFFLLCIITRNVQ